MEYLNDQINQLNLTINLNEQENNNKSDIEHIDKLKIKLKE